MKRVPPQSETIVPLLISLWRKFSKTPGPADRLQTREFRSVVNAIKQLRQGWQPSGKLWGQEPLKQPELLGAYLLYYWQLHYQEGLSFLAELPRAPRRVLDVCSGAAPFAYAALRHGAQEVIAWDRNREALNLGAQLCGRSGYPLTLRYGDAKGADLSKEKPFDLIIVGHALFDLFPYASWNKSLDRPALFISSLLQKLSPEGHLLLVDSSDNESNTLLLKLRDRLVSEGAHLHAPCIWQGNCPALEKSGAPCYAQREMEKPFLLKELQRAAEINLSSLKATYLIFRPTAPSYPEHKPLYRVISPALPGPQGKTFYLCGTESKKQLSSHLTPTPEKARAFDFLRRGDLITYSDLTEEGNRLTVKQESSVKLSAPCDQPP